MGYTDMEPPPLAEVEKMIRNVHRMKTEENKFQAVFDTVKERELTAKAASLSEYSDEGLVVATQELFHKRFEESVEYQKQIEYWIQEDPSRIEQFEEEIANMVNSGRKLGLGTLLVLGKFADKARHTSDKLAWELELSRGLTIDPETLDMLSALMQRNDEEANYAVHKVLDFFRQYMFTVQNRTGQNIEAKYGSYYGGMFQDLHRYVSRVQEEQYAQNYLVSRHIDDLAEMYCIVTGGEKEGVLIGVGGGAQDEIIYANRRAEESYKNQLKYGLVTHDPTIDVILPVAKGYVGLYQRGVLKEVFPERKDNVYDEQEFIDNYSNVQWPYEKIEDTLMDVYRPGNDSSIGLLVLQDLNDIGRYMREKGDLFFFDLLKVDKDRLHPYVYERILAMNSTTVAKVKGRERRTQSIDASMQEKLISPTRELTDQEQCLYEYCMSLQMRKKIEDDFGIDLGNLGLWQQRSFLSFIEKATVDQADDLRAFVEDYGEVGVSIFVAGEEDPQVVEQIVEAGLREDLDICHRVFNKFHEIVEVVNELDDQIKAQFSDLDIQSRVMLHSQAAAKGILRRALKVIAEGVNHIEQEDVSGVESLLERARTDVIAFSAIFKTAFKGEQEVNFEDVKGLDFQSTNMEDVKVEDRERMLDILKENWSNRGEEGQRLILDFGNRIMHGDPNSDYYLLKRDGEVVSFLRFEPYVDENEVTMEG